MFFVHFLNCTDVAMYAVSVVICVCLFTLVCLVVVCFRIVSRLLLDRISSLFVYVCLSIVSFVNCENDFISFTFAWFVLSYLT